MILIQKNATRNINEESTKQKLSEKLMSSVGRPANFPAFQYSIFRVEC